MLDLSAFSSAVLQSRNERRAVGGNLASHLRCVLGVQNDMSGQYTLSGEEEDDQNEEEKLTKVSFPASVVLFIRYALSGTDSDVGGRGIRLRRVVSCGGGTAARLRRSLAQTELGIPSVCRGSWVPSPCTPLFLRDAPSETDAGCAAARLH